MGYRLDEGIQMGPLLSRDYMLNVMNYIEKGEQKGANLLWDWRKVVIENFPDGALVDPKILDEVTPDMTISRGPIGINC